MSIFTRPHLLMELLAYLWNGPSDLPRALKLEWRFVAVRWLGIAFVTPAVLLANLGTERLLAAYAVIAVAAFYNGSVMFLMPRRPQLLANGYLTTLGDGLLDIAMVVVGGGFDSPFYFILFTVTIAAAMRYGYGPSLGVALLYVAADGAGHVIEHTAFDGPFAFRSLLLPLTTVLAGYLREQAQQAEAALQERLRQSNALNEATAALGASLELEAVLRAAIAAAAQLFGSPSAVLQPSSGLDGDLSSLPAPIHFPDAEDSSVHRSLLKLCGRYARGRQRSDESLITVELLPSGNQAIVLMLALPTRHTSLATLALAVPHGASITLDSDILDAFVERITLAIENASLYRTLAGRSNDLQRAYSDLAAAHQELLGVDEMKTNFLANVSHELRTPLTSIRSFSELLLAYEDDAAVHKEFLRIINSESERLTRLVNDVLDITKIEAGHMDWQMATLNLPDLLRDSARTFGPLIAKGKLTFDLDIADDLPPIYGDRDRLHQVVANLLNNAMKFTQVGTITLKGELQGDAVVITVSDTGIGIAGHDQERIFEKFQQVGDTLTDKPRGTGLGLAICRDIVEFHQGRLGVESKPGIGSTFTVSLPIATDQSLARAA
ncbi:MAG TPA: HAMP domain-containing sensor histidine kinase [Chloroflexota bacterium]|jgi:signal transduction histidine kinase